MLTEFLSSYEDLQTFLQRERDNGKELSGITVLSRFSDFIDKLDNKHIIGVIHELYNKWPHVIRISELKRGAKRAIQRRYYSEIYRTDEIPQKVIDSDERCIVLMDLRDEKYVAPQPVHLKQFKPPKPKKIRERTSTPRVRKPRSMYADKVNDMSLEDLIKWSLEAGVPQERINKHKDKSIGLAKMNISNLLRHMLKKDPKNDDLLADQ